MLSEVFYLHALERRTIHILKISEGICTSRLSRFRQFKLIIITALLLSATHRSFGYRDKGSAYIHLECILLVKKSWTNSFCNEVSLITKCVLKVVQ